MFSNDGRRFVVSRTAGQTVVVNADTGSALPALQQLPLARTSPHRHAFTADGRLLVLAWTDAREPKKMPGGGPGLGGFAPRPTALSVWDTRTGKLLKSWPSSPRVAFHPTKPILAILEPNGTENTRVGFWDFAADGK
ncbi:MAG: hypothetical protein FJ304_12390 [Planctomycetes bacterium]|nr:hypothetical protein [Planctomycetota bacterium]